MTAIKPTHREINAINKPLGYLIFSLGLLWIGFIIVKVELQGNRELLGYIPAVIGLLPLSFASNLVATVRVDNRAVVYLRP